MNTPTPGCTFGERLGCVREEKGLTKSAMANSLHVAPSTWGNYENDTSFPCLSTIRLFCKLYNVNLEWLMENEGPMYLE